MKILFTFPGQGTQTPGMLQSLPPGSNALLQQASDVLGESASQLDSIDALQHTRAVQLCLLIVGVAWARYFASVGIQPDIVSGLSIGAFPAAVTAGALSFEDALHLVALRGTLMEQAWPQGYGLTAINGLSYDQLAPLLGDSYLANFNSEFQFVIAGSDTAMAATAERAKAAGARKVVRLAVSVPSHCILLERPAVKLHAALANVCLQNPQIAYLSSNTARIVWQPQAIADDLAFNMARPVHWYNTMVAAQERAVGLSVEMPPGATLTGLCQGIIDHAISVAQIGAQTTVTLVNRIRQQRY